MRKTVALFLSLIVILANTASLRSIELLPDALWEPAVAVEFTVLGFISVSSLPLRILNTIVAGDSAFCGERGQVPQKKTENKQERNTASDPLIGFSPAQLKAADSVQRTAVSAAAVISRPAFFRDAAFPVRGEQGPPGFVFLSILVFLVILSLSNLPAGMLLLCRSYSRSRRIRTGIFFCSKKTVSLLTACCFLFSSVFAPAVQAAVEAAKSDVSFTALRDDVIIPPTIGRITQGKYYGNGKLVIAVQDLHCHPEAQRHISEILAVLDRRYRLNTVYVEGAYGQVDTSRLGKIGDTGLRTEIVETLLEDGRLTGSEYYSITSGKPLLLKGLEDEGLHRANIARLGRILEKKEAFKAVLARLDKDLAGMEAKYCGEKSKRLNRVIDEYRRGKIDGRKYYAALSKYVNDINRHPERYNPLADVRMDDYPNMRAYMALDDLRDGLRYKRISRDLQGFLRLLQAKLPYPEFTALRERTGDFTRLDELYILLAQIAGENASLETRTTFPDLARFFDYLEKSRSVNPLAMVEEEGRLLEALRVGLSGDISELEVSFLADFYGVFRDYLLNSLSAQEYAYFTQKSGAFKRLWEKYAPVDRITGMEDDFKLLDEYYAANDARNGRFIEHVAELGAVPAVPVPAKGEGLERLLPVLGVQEPGDVIVMVTGGFHTEGLAKLFEERNISYCTITPAVTGDTAASAVRYDDLAAQQAKILSQALALGLASQLPSTELCELVIRAAHRQLLEAGFTRDNLQKLAGELGKATGTEVTVALKGEKAALFTIPGGRTFLITREGVDTSTLPLRPTGRGPAAERVVLEELLAAIKGTGRTVNGALGWLTLVPESYQVMRNLFTFAAEHHLVFGDGLLFELDNNPRLANTIDWIPRELVADFPEEIQRIVWEHVRRETDLADAAKRSQWLEVLCAVALLRDFLVAAGADLTEPEAEYEEPAAEDEAGTEAGDEAKNEEDDLGTLMRLSNLKRVILEQYFFSPGLHPINRELLETILSRMDGIFSKAIPATGPELENEYNELLAATVNVIHSQAWLSPTPSSSLVRERGILQGDQYYAFYEREHMNPLMPERYLARFVNEGRSELADNQQVAILYRNVNSLLADLCSVFLHNYKPSEIFVSPNLPRGLKKTLNMTLRRSRNPAGEAEADVYFIAADELENFAADPDDLTGITFVVCADRPVDIPPSLRDSGADIFIVYSFEKQVPGAALPIAFVTNYTELFEESSWVFKDLRVLRERSGNIDSYAAWYLALYYDQTNPKHLDSSGTPYYYDALGPDLVREQVQKMGERYDALLALLGTVSAGTRLDRAIIRRLESRIRAHAAAARSFSSRGPPADINACRFALSEYRTILKHVAYLQWLSALRSGHVAERHAEVERKLDRQYNGLMAPMRDARGAELPRSTLLASSGMGAIKTVLAFATRADGNRKPALLIGNNVYYEIDSLVKDEISGQKIDIVRIRERDTNAVIEAAASGAYRALVLDTVSNAVASPVEESMSEDEPVADMQAILRKLVTLQYAKPFYVVIDASLAGPSFQINEYLNGVDLPANFHIIVYSSLQKMYQDGQELTAGGVITLISANEQEHKVSSGLLAGTRSSLGMGPSLLSCLLLDALSLDKAALAGKSSRILANAQALAESLEADIRRTGARDRDEDYVVHPALPSHPDHNVWAGIGKPGLPFVILRLEHPNDILTFVKIFARKLVAEGIPVQERDSYGFSHITYSFYFPHTEKMALRVNMPPYGDREMETVKRVFGEAYAELRGKAVIASPGSHLILPRNLPYVLAWKKEGKPDWWIAKKVAFSLERRYAFFHPFKFYREHGEPTRGRFAGMVLTAALSYLPAVIGAIVVPLFAGFSGIADLAVLAATGAVAGVMAGYQLGATAHWVWDIITLKELQPDTVLPGDKIDRGPDAAGMPSSEARIPVFDESVREDIDAVVAATQGAEILVGIPCYDEKENLPALVAQVQAGLAARGKRAAIVVIGERVKPETVQAALALDGARGVRVVGFTKDPRFAGLEGKKWSERAFFAIAQKLQSRVFISFDADMKIDPTWVEKLAAPVLDGDADFVTPDYVRRYTADDKSLTHHIVAPLFSAMYGYAISEPVGGEFAVRVKGSGLLAAYLDTPGIWTAPCPYEGLYLAGAFTRSAKVKEVWLGTKVHKLMTKGNYAELASRIYAQPMFDQMLRDWDHIIARTSDPTVRETGNNAPAMAADTAEVLDIRYDEWIAAYRAGFEKHRALYRKEFPYLFDRLEACYKAADPGAYGVTAAPWEAFMLILLKQYRAADRERRDLLMEALAPVFLARVITFSAQMRGKPYKDMTEALRRQTAEFAALKPFLASRETDKDFFERVTGSRTGAVKGRVTGFLSRFGRSVGAMLWSRLPYYEAKDIAPAGKPQPDALSLEEQINRIPDTAEKNRLKRVLELDGAVEDHLFVTDENGRVDRLDVIDASQISAADRGKLIESLSRWSRYGGMRKRVVFTMQVSLMIRELKAVPRTGRPALLSRVLAVSRYGDGGIRDVEAIGMYERRNNGIQVHDFEVAPWNRGRQKRFKGLGSQLNAWIFTHGGPGPIAITRPFPGIEDLFGRYTPKGEYPWVEMKDLYWLRRDIVDTFIKDQAQRSASAQQKERDKLASGMYREPLPEALPPEKRVKRIPDTAERNRLGRVLELDGAGDHLFVEDRNGKADRLDVIDISKLDEADRAQLIPCLYRWREYAGPEQVAFETLFRHTLQVLEKGSPQKFKFANLVLAVSRDRENRIRDIEALGMYEPRPSNTTVWFLEAAPWNRGGQRYKGAGSQLLSWMFTHPGSRHVSFVSPSRDMENLFKPHARRGGDPWIEMDRLQWLEEDVRDAFVKDQEERAALIKQRERELLFRGAYDVKERGHTVMGAIRRLITGFMSRTGTMQHAVICYRYIKDDAVVHNLPSVTVVNGQIYVMITLRDGHGRANTGMKVEVDGLMPSVRADVSDGGLTLCIDGITGENKYDKGNKNDVIAQISAMLSGTGAISGNKRAVRRLKKLLGRVSDVSLRNVDFNARPVRIDHEAKGKVSYSNDGSLVVPAELFDAAADEKQKIALLGQLIAVRNAESFAMARNLFVYMDTELNIEDFKRELKAFRETGNTQMIIPESVFIGMDKKTIREIAHLALRAGVRIYVNSVSGRLSNPDFGFSGFALVSSGIIHDFTLGDLKSTLITGFKNVDGLQEAFYSSGAGAKILKFSELQAMKDGEGRLLWAETITVLRTNVIRFVTPQAVTRDYVRGVAYGLGWEEIPTAGDFEALLAASRSGKWEDAVPGDSAAGRYLDKLGGDVADKKKAGELRAAFLEAVAERVLVKATLNPKKFKAGLADTTLEQVFGMKLLQQKVLATGEQGARQEVIARLNEMTKNGATAAGVAAALKTGVNALCKEPDDAQAINTIIELIGQLGEPKVLPRDKVEITPFDESSVNAILGAA